jgi:hypothetical protein
MQTRRVLEAVVAFVALHERVAAVAFVAACLAASGERDHRHAHATEHGETGEQRLPIRLD